MRQAAPSCSRVLASLLAPAMALLCALAGPARALEASADARVDLVGLIQLLAGEREASGPVKPALADFARLRSHPAVKKYAAMTGFRGHFPVQYALYLSTDARSEAHPVPELFIHAAGGRAALTAFRLDLADFASDGDFFSWRERHGELIASPAQALRRELARQDLEEPLLNYLGWRSWSRWIVVPSPFAGFGASWILEEKPGLPDIYVILPPDWAEGAPVFPTGMDLGDEIWGEPVYSATYLISELCRPHLAAAGRGCASEPQSCIQGLITKGVISRLKRVDASPRQTSSQRRVEKALARYEAHRKDYPDLVSFRESLLAAVGGIKTPSCPLSQPSRLQEEVFKRRSAWYAEREGLGR